MDSSRRAHHPLAVGQARALAASALALSLLASACSVEPLLTVGRRCSDDSQCAPGLVCDRTTNRCAARSSPDLPAPRLDTRADSADSIDTADAAADAARGDVTDTTPIDMGADRAQSDNSVDAPPADGTVDTAPATPCCTRWRCKTSCHLFTIANLTITGLTDKDADGCRVYGDPDAVPARLRIVVFTGGVLKTLALHNGTSSSGQVVSFSSNLPQVTVSAQYATQGGTATRSELVCE